MVVPTMTATQTNSKDTKTSNADLLARLAQLEAENAKLKQAQQARLSLKVSEKRAVSLYGCGRFPVTLYREQWRRVLGMSETILKFIQDNDDKLAKKQ